MPCSKRAWASVTKSYRVREIQVYAPHPCTPRIEAEKPPFCGLLLRERVVECDLARRDAVQVVLAVTLVDVVGVAGAVGERADNMDLDQAHADQVAPAIADAAQLAQYDRAGEMTQPKMTRYLNK